MSFTVSFVPVGGVALNVLVATVLLWFQETENGQRKLVDYRIMIHTCCHRGIVSLSLRCLQLQVPGGTSLHSALNRVTSNHRMSLTQRCYAYGVVANSWPMNIE